MELGIIHQDISAGNMLLYNAEGAWQGLLNDWELSKTMEQQQEEMGRQPDRTVRTVIYVLSSVTFPHSLNS